MQDKEPEVIYTGMDLYRLSNPDTAEYDGKLCSKSDGGFAIYDTESNWVNHGHIEYDKNGHEVFRETESDRASNPHPWENRDRD